MFLYLGFQAKLGSDLSLCGNSMFVFGFFISDMDVGFKVQVFQASFNNTLTLCGQISRCLFYTLVAALKWSANVKKALGKALPLCGQLTRLFLKCPL